MKGKNREVTYCDLNLIDYKQAWDLQKNIFELRYNKKISDVLFLLEHPHTYTLGKAADRNHLVGSKEYLQENNISVYDIDRGGDITYHGPGQIVGYPIIDLQEWNMDTHKYLRALEEVLIKTCEQYGIESTRIQKYTGVWTNDKKIAAIGIKVSRWITMHGFALNVNTNLNFFNGIIPCGISDKEVTSIQKETGKQIEIKEVKDIIVNNFKEVFGYNVLTPLPKEELSVLNLTNSIMMKG